MMNFFDFFSFIFEADLCINIIRPDSVENNKTKKIALHNSEKNFRKKNFENNQYLTKNREIDSSGLNFKKIGAKASGIQVKFVIILKTRKL